MLTLNGIPWSEQHCEKHFLTRLCILNVYKCHISVHIKLIYGASLFKIMPKSFQFDIAYS